MRPYIGSNVHVHGEIPAASPPVLSVMKILVHYRKKIIKLIFNDKTPPNVIMKTQCPTHPPAPPPPSLSQTRIAERQHLALQAPQLDENDLPRQREAGDAHQSRQRARVVPRGGGGRGRRPLVDRVAPAVHEPRLELVAVPGEVHVRPRRHHERIDLAGREGGEGVRPGGRHVSVREGAMQGVDARRRGESPRGPAAAPAGAVGRHAVVVVVPPPTSRGTS